MSVFLSWFEMLSQPSEIWYQDQGVDLWVLLLFAFVCLFVSDPGEYLLILVKLSTVWSTNWFHISFFHRELLYRSMLDHI